MYNTINVCVPCPLYEIKWQKTLRHSMRFKGLNFCRILLTKVQRSIFNLGFNPNTHYRTRVHTHTHTHTHAHTNIYTYTHTHVHAYIHTRTCIHTNTYMHTYIHTYTCIHTCTTVSLYGSASINKGNVCRESRMK